MKLSKDCETCYDISNKKMLTLGDYKFNPCSIPAGKLPQDEKVVTLTANLSEESIVKAMINLAGRLRHNSFRKSGNESVNAGTRYKDNHQVFDM